MTYETTKFPSSRKAMLVGASAMIALGAAWASPAHAAEFQPGDDIKITYSKITEGAGGNAWIKEAPAIVNRGVISRVEVCGGRYIDGITFFYKGRRGTKFGGNGGNCESFYVPKEQFINEVIVWRGDWINAIQFVTTDGEGGRSESKVYGDPAGAARVPVQAPDGGSLRIVHGKGGAYVNQLELAFGLPYYISDIDIRFDKPLKEIVASDPKQIDVVHGDNCGNSRGSLEMENAFSKSVTESHNFTFSNTTGFELSTEVNVGLPVLAEGKIGISASSEFTFEKSEGAETTETVSRGYKYSVPPGRRIDGAYVARTADVELPFTYNLYHYRNGNRDDHLKPSTYEGVYKGVLVASAATKLYEVDCQTGERVLEYDDPEDIAKSVTSTASTAAPVPVKASARPASPPATNATVPTTATVTSVSTSTDARFVRKDHDLWHEISADGDTRFTFEVIDRDEDCIFLLDLRRDVLVILDLSRNKVQYAPNVDAEPFDIYDIVAAS